MDPRIFETGTDDIVLNLIQGERLPANPAKPYLPGTRKPAPDILDGGYRIMFQDEFNGIRVIGIDIEGQLLISRQLFRVRFIQHGEIPIQFSLFGLQPLIVHHTVLDILL